MGHSASGLGPQVHERGAAVVTVLPVGRVPFAAVGADPVLLSPTHVEAKVEQEAQQHQFTYCSQEHPCKFCAAQLMDAQDIESLDELYRVEGEILVAYEQSTEKRRKSQNEFWAIQNVIEAITKIEDKAYELKRKLEKLQDMDVA